MPVAIAAYSRAYSGLLYRLASDGVVPRVFSVPIKCSWYVIWALLYRGPGYGIAEYVRCTSDGIVCV